MLIYALDCAVSELSRFMESNGPTEDLHDQLTNDNDTNGWKCESDNPQDTSSVFLALSPSIDHPHATIEDPEGLWRGIAVGQLEKEVLQAVGGPLSANISRATNSSKASLAVHFESVP
ncbi:hypothetical protein HanHA300_Chr15g0564361 [Helianthus annuus]|nr:hypothetical protein HanHA300_Chr15g0564361 [Helianthus annuus]